MAMKVSAPPERRPAVTAKTIAVEARSDRPTSEPSPSAHEVDNGFSSGLDTWMYRQRTHAP